jgi:hypothetical protein
MNGSTDMANKRVIPITAGAQRSKRGRVVVQANNGTSGIEIHAHLTTDGAALGPQSSGPGTEPSGVTEEISFRGCDERIDDKKTYSIGSDCRMQVLAAGRATPGDALTFSTLEELTASTRDWRLPQLVSLWNQLPGVQAVKRFENRQVAIERVWRAIEKLQPQTPPRQRKRAQKESTAVRTISKSERIVALLQAPEGATLGALMEATGWQAHSIRGFLSGTVSKRLGLQVDSFRRDGERVYAFGTAPSSEQPMAATEAEASAQEGA